MGEALIECGCGCGRLRSAFDARGVPRKYLSGHSNVLRRQPREGTTTAIRCKRCERLRPSDKFYDEPLKVSGKKGTCKDCFNAQGKTFRQAHKVQKRGRDWLWRRLHPDRVAAKDARYHQRYPGLRGARTDAWQAKYPERRRAHIIVQGAIRTGRLIRPSQCVDCGHSGRIEGHHPDYSKPLEVQWLCKPCHAMLCPH